MIQESSLTLITIPDFMAMLGYEEGKGKSTYYAQSKEGYLPPPLKAFGERASRVPKHEAELVVAAILAGQPKSEIKALVKALAAKRGDIFQSLTRNFPQAA